MRKQGFLLFRSLRKAFQKFGWPSNWGCFRHSCPTTPQRTTQGTLVDSATFTQVNSHGFETFSTRKCWRQIQKQGSSITFSTELPLKRKTYEKCPCPFCTWGPWAHTWIHQLLHPKSWLFHNRFVFQVDSLPRSQMHMGCPGHWPLMACKTSSHSVFIALLRIEAK